MPIDLSAPEIRAAITLAEAQLEGEQRDRKIPGISAGIVYDQQLIWQHGYGFSDLEKKIPADGRTVYRIASITKPIPDAACAPSAQRTTAVEARDSRTAVQATSADTARAKVRVASVKALGGAWRRCWRSPSFMASGGLAKAVTVIASLLPGLVGKQGAMAATFAHHRSAVIASGCRCGQAGR